MSNATPAPRRWRGRLLRSWHLVWPVVSAVLVGPLAFYAVYAPAIDELGPQDPGSVRLATLLALDVLAAPVAIGLLAWRHRPVPGAVVVLLSAISTLSVGAGVLAVVSFATAQPLRRTVAVGVAFTALSTLPALLMRDPELPWWVDVVGAATVYALLALVGSYVRSRRQLLASLRTEARSTQREREALRAGAEAAERARIAREMHDALGHRLSVIAMHAGALESRSDLSTEDTQRAAGVVRESAHRAMGDLRQVLGVLDESSSARSEGSDVPSLAQLDELLGAGVGGGVVPTLHLKADLATLPDDVSRHLYRVAQEALTNVRKHAPGQPTEVVVSTPARGRVALLVRNALPSTAVPAVPAASTTGALRHHGLTGLAERARLAGGSLSAGPDGPDFLVRVVLPCRR